MTEYVKTTNFTVKDGLTTGNPDKIIRGTEIDDELDAIELAVTSKANRASPTFTGTATMANLTVTGTSVIPTIDGGTY